MRLCDMKKSSNKSKQVLHWPLETEIGALDLAARFAVEPEDESFLLVVVEPIADSFERTDDVLDDALAMSLENIEGKVVRIVLEMRTDCFVGAVGKTLAAGIVESGEKPVGRWIGRIDR